MSEIAELNAIDLEVLFRTKRLSPVEVAKDALARIERFEPAINAFILRDDVVPLAMAAASEARWMAGSPLGPLDGVPITIKDNLVAKGWPTRRGSVLASSEPATSDAPAVSRMREAGAVFLGKTTMPEYGWKGVGDSPLSGITRNPWNLATTPGGSSAGAAACAALNLGCLHLGTDGAGSVRIPAGFTGVVGFKPTYGHVPAYPVSTMGFLAHLGPLARTVREIALAMNAIGRPDIRDMTATLAPVMDFSVGLGEGVKGLRIAYSPRLGFDVEVDPEIAALTEVAARKFEALGATVERADPGFADPIEALMTLWSAGAALALANISRQDRGRMDPGLVAVAEAGERVSGAEYVEALLNKRNVLALVMAEFHARFDLLLTPTLPLPAFEAGRLTPAQRKPAHGRYGADWTAWTPFTYPFNLTQQPAVSVPSGVTSTGMPAGLQIIGAFGADALVLKAAAAYEGAAPFARLSAPRGNGKAVVF